ncbi:hypothetical protein ERCG_04604 [Escherichia coli E1520]|nr:hypothetical protein ERCG_04604 [Escherichia coli E1520]
MIAWRITLFSDPMAFVSDSDNSYRWNEMDKRFSVDDTPNEPNRFGWVGKSIHMVIFQKIIRTSVLYITR